ncbi:MAG: tol-pal system protein YbgF [Rhodobacteraceae bacterium]|nr:tol-pal system protein YbgF [Paracoccaceae bacterium]
MRLILPLLALSLAAAPALAQDKAQTLADIRIELDQLAAEFNALKAEMTTTGAGTAGLGGGDALQRMDTIEAELARLTARTEEIELRLGRVVADGTNRIGDIEFRLCEATEGCDPMSLGKTAELGGGGTAAPPDAGGGAATTGGPELAVAEKEDFDRAKEVLGQGDFPGAATLFATYAQSYPGGPLVPEAHFLRGEALRQAGDLANAGRAYLDSYSSDPQGALAPDALLQLGGILGQLGQMNEACVTLGQIATQYPASSAAGQAPAVMQGLGCS